MPIDSHLEKCKSSAKSSHELSWNVGSSIMKYWKFDTLFSRTENFNLQILFFNRSLIYFQHIKIMLYSAFLLNMKVHSTVSLNTKWSQIELITLTNNCGFQIYKDSSGDMFSSSCLAEECVERVITSSNGLITRHLTIRLDTVLKAVQLPACIAHLDTGLANVYGDTFTLLRKLKIIEKKLEHVCFWTHYVTLWKDTLLLKEASHKYAIFNTFVCLCNFFYFNDNLKEPSPILSTIFPTFGDFGITKSSYFSHNPWKISWLKSVAFGRY